MAGTLGANHGNIKAEHAWTNQLVCMATGQAGAEIGMDHGPTLTCNHEAPVVAYRTSPNCGAWETGDKVDALTTGTDPTSHILATFQQSSMQGRGTMGYDESGIAKPCKTQTDGQMIQIGTAVRRLTPAECEALQGFPRGYTLVPFNGKLAKDGPRYKAIGNSWAVPVVRRIGERIAMVDAL